MYIENLNITSEKYYPDFDTGTVYNYTLYSIHMYIHIVIHVLVYISVIHFYNDVLY